MQKTAPGIIYTRTGRRFFDNLEHEQLFLAEIHRALTGLGFWEKFNTDWVCLDEELLPWSSKAKALIINQYAAVGTSALNGLNEAELALQIALSRGIQVDGLLQETVSLKAALADYVTSYRNYCQETNGIEGLIFAPFHILAMEGKTYKDQQHIWHLEQLKNICSFNQVFLLATNNLLVDLQDEKSVKAGKSVKSGISWWLEMTAKGGEGMVVKPLDFIPTNKGRIIQPAIKCRSSEYLWIIYGPEYDLTDNLPTLKKRNVKAKRMMAIQEFTLGLESLERFVKQEHLRRIHECVFGVVALESESVDPRF